MALDVVEQPPVIELDELAAHIAEVEKAVPAEGVTDALKPEPKAEDKPKPEAKVEIPAEHEVIDPETGDKVDGRTREGRRIAGLLKRTHEAESDARKSRELAASLLERQKPAQAEDKVVQKADAKPAPKSSDYSTVEEYLDAAIKHGVDTALAVDRAARQAEVTQREAQSRNAKVAEREAVFVKEHPDYREHIDAFLIPDLAAGVKVGHPTALALNQALIHSEQGPQLAYRLSQNKGAEHARLAALPPELALIELGKLLQPETVVSETKEKVKEERRSAAPPPPEIVAGRSSAADPDPMNVDFETHVAMGNRRDAEASRSHRRGAA